MSTSPFQTPYRGLEPSWLDYNGHLNMAYYNVLFDQAIDLLFSQLGCGEIYRVEENMSFFTAEAHVCYVRELKPDSLVRTDIRVVDCDDKRLHVFEELYHQDGWLSATSETLLLHINMAGPKVAAMPADLATKINDMKAAHAHLPANDRIGRSISIKRK